MKKSWDAPRLLSFVFRLAFLMPLLLPFRSCLAFGKTSSNLQVIRSGSFFPRTLRAGASNQGSIRMSSSEKVKASRGDSIGGDGITLIPEDEEYTNVVVWNHGLGDTAMGWYSAMPAFGLTKTKFILPTAPTRPITLNMGMAMPGWSDIRGLDKEDDEDEPGFEESRARIESIVRSEVDKGISPSKIVVGGFSQGGALALYYSLQNTHGIAGCVGFSSWLPLSAKFPAAVSDAARGGLKILQCHGDADEVVRTAWGKLSHEKIKGELGFADAAWEEYPGMAHSACDEELQRCAEFLKGLFGQS
uniref:Phospholipase/carboxylesterase/thioesterase domain-containing protein n=1 Tax=Heterosigma akashiwo TaxID=2829 RepID=A0A6V1K3U7_HETAK|mmetsp:Transcript_25221/g.42063  ORF Transcript_25221/g.42063 Transcript_25221/m.42063 type:complete len:303 (+) Transcript_25221:49-957(+)